MFTKDFCVGKLYYSLNGNLQNLYNAIFIPESRKKWDTSVIEYKIEKKISDCINIIYIIRKGILLMKNRDYYIKRVTFYNHNKIYYYCSAIPLNLETKNTENVRASTIIDAGMLKEENSKLEYFTCMQMDPKVIVGQEIIKSLLHTTAEGIHQKLSVFLSENNISI